MVGAPSRSTGAAAHSAGIAMPAVSDPIQLAGEVLGSAGRAMQPAGEALRSVGGPMQSAEALISSVLRPDAGRRRGWRVRRRVLSVRRHGDAARPRPKQLT